MKIRASIGLLGNDDVSPYAFLSTYNLMDGNKNAYQTILNGKVMQALRASVISKSYSDVGKHVNLQCRFRLYHVEWFTGYGI
ncbi:hypothetical protein NXV22_04955 [Bacteroides thetaiotaomicron]|nr:hypothetical protein [Bacteroides thetaiotaomicron]